MKRELLLIIGLLGMFCLSATDIGDWQNIRCSGMTAANQVFVRLENELSPAADNTLLYYNGTSITEQAFSELNPATGSMQSAYTAVDTNADLGLIAAGTGPARKVKPVYYSGSGLPGLGQYTKSSSDPANDQSTNHLDIVADYFTFSGTKFYAAIQNRGGGFPLTGALGFPPYYSYMYAIADPASDPTDPNTIVWVLNYIEVLFGGLEPGLFKITGTEPEDLIRIGDISTEIVSGSNLLKMSCNIADLLADPDFLAWYNPANPVIGTVSLTNKTTLSGLTPVTVNTDTSTGARVYPKRLYNQLHPEVLPSLNNYGFHITEGDIYFQTDYLDLYGRFPLSLKAEWLPGQSFELLPQSLDHSQSVTYRSADLTGLLNEYDEVPTHAAASLDNLSWAYSDTLNYSYILGLQAPTDLALDPAEENSVLSWSPVTQTLLGNPVIPDYYQVEADIDPYFGSALVLASPTGTSTDVNLDQAYRFFRVTAVKNIP